MRQSQRHPAINLVLRQIRQHTHPVIFFNRIIALLFMQNGWQILQAGSLMQAGGVRKKLAGDC